MGIRKWLADAEATVLTMSSCGGCMFCGTRKDLANTLDGPDVMICTGCVDVCLAILEDRLAVVEREG